MDGIVPPHQLAAWRKEVMDAFEAEWAAAKQGAYKESAREFLSSSWQGDALSVRKAPCSAEGGGAF
jgi:hypothetical protein